MSRELLQIDRDEFATSSYAEITAWLSATSRRTLPESTRTSLRRRRGAAALPIVMSGDVRFNVSASEWIARPSVSHCRCVSLLLLGDQPAASRPSSSRRRPRARAPAPARAERRRRPPVTASSRPVRQRACCLLSVSRRSESCWLWRAPLLDTDLDALLPHLARRPLLLDRLRALQQLAAVLRRRRLVVREPLLGGGAQRADVGVERLEHDARAVPLDRVDPPRGACCRAPPRRRPPRGAALRLLLLRRAHLAHLELQQVLARAALRHLLRQRRQVVVQRLESLLERRRLRLVRRARRLCLRTAAASGRSAPPSAPFACADSFSATSSWRVAASERIRSTSSISTSLSVENDLRSPCTWSERNSSSAAPQRRAASRISASFFKDLMCVLISISSGRIIAAVVSDGVRRMHGLRCAQTSGVSRRKKRLRLLRALAPATTPTSHHPTFTLTTSLPGGAVAGQAVRLAEQDGASAIA